MTPLFNFGRTLYCVAIFGFAIQYFIYATAGSGAIPGFPWIPGRVVAAYCIGIFLLLASVSIIFGIKTRLSAMCLAIFLLIYCAWLYVSRIIAQVHNPGPWTSSAELASISGAALMLIWTEQNGTPLNPEPGLLYRIGSLLFGIPLLVFGIQHFLYAQFVATLVPAWIPGRLFWAYFVGASFVAASSAIATKIKAPLAAELLGSMFLIWVLILHAPRVAGAPHNGNEWTSAFVALAMSGGAFIAAGSLTRRAARHQS